MAGGVRSGRAQGEIGRLVADRTQDPADGMEPVVACWEGRIAAVGPRSRVEARARRRRATRSAGSRGSTPPAGS